MISWWWAVAVRSETAEAADTDSRAKGERAALRMVPSPAGPRRTRGRRRFSARARHLFPGGVTHDVRLADPFPLAVARAEGARKWDLDGHEPRLLRHGLRALLLGHRHPEVVSAVRAQAGRFFHPGANHEQLECDWAELVIRLVPPPERVRFTSSGTEASLLALRWPGRPPGGTRSSNCPGALPRLARSVVRRLSTPPSRPAGQRLRPARARPLHDGDRHPGPTPAASWPKAAAGGAMTSRP